MWLIYDLGIRLYLTGIQLAALFDNKARLWVRGRKEQRDRHIIRHPGNDQRKVAWFHCASLGEFEQGRPVIEALKKQYPDWIVVLTFFSPSGYEIRKNYQGADHVLYLPMDTPGNVKKFLDEIRPSLAIFVKYEFWFRYLDRLHQQNVPTFLVSGIFRPGQHFFRWYGGWFRKQLRNFTHFFVQDPGSEALLKSIGINEVSVSGDTRFDRVAAIASGTKPFPLVEAFAAGSRVFLAGSTWPEDEELILKLMQQSGEDLKFIFAPHEVDDSRIEALINKVSNTISDNSKFKIQNSKLLVRFSQLTQANAGTARVLIVDGIGYLSHLYQYATVAYIGGGFGVGIHNILEAATFGKPVVFGPNYHKFREAVELAAAGGAFPVKDETGLTGKMQKTSSIARNYVEQNCGATSTILQYIFKKVLQERQ